MMDGKDNLDSEDQEISLLREWLPKISGESRSYIKGASIALLYAQENERPPPDLADSPADPCIEE